MTTVPLRDLESCAREPIHIPGSIQPQGALLVLDPDSFTVLQASENAGAVLGCAVRTGSSLPAGIDVALPGLRAWIAAGDSASARLARLDGRSLYAVAHRADEAVILEFEASPAPGHEAMERLFPRLRIFTEQLGSAPDISALSEQTARYLRELTGFDRVLVYQFDSDWNGRVIGEDGNGVLPSYLDLRFPAADIPAQARQLYKANRLRVIPDAGYRPVPILPADNPLTGKPIDLSFAVLRSVSPVHLEYMRNMGTAASMSVSILIDGELWGLASCHSRAPHGVPLTIRNICDFAVQAFATEIAARERAGEAASRVRLGGILTRLLARMTGASDWRRGLTEAGDDLLSQVDASGAAIVFGDDYRQVGAAPNEEQLRAIVAWLEDRGETEAFASENLAGQMPAAEAFADVASGLLAIRISELHASWLLWFRPEVVSTVAWGGDPHKPVIEAGRIHPRRSFQAWSEQVRLRARPWSSAEIAAARDLRGAIIGIVLRRAEELAQLTTELQRSNKELEAFSYSVSHDLRAPFRHIVGYSELLRDRETQLDEKSRHYLESIVESARAAGRLVEDLLNFSHIGRTAISPRHIDMDKLVVEVRQSLAQSAEGRQIVWGVGPLPPAWGDPILIRQVWFNLMENAVKYTRPRAQASISLSGSSADGRSCYAVRDNGVGFNMSYVEKIFGVFQRLQRAEDFEGTGIGLALARRIVERHHGRIWAEGEVDQGASFYFVLPTKNAGPANA